MATFTSTYRVALLILQIDYETFGRKVQLTNEVCTEDGISEKEKWRAVRELERLEMIKVERKGKYRAPTITIIR
jgi:hypothetical protein